MTHMSTRPDDLSIGNASNLPEMVTEMEVNYFRWLAAPLQIQHLRGHWEADGAPSWCLFLAPMTYSMGCYMLGVEGTANSTSKHQMWLGAV